MTLNILLAVVAVSAQETTSPKVKVSGFVESQTNFTNGSGETSTSLNSLTNISFGNKKVGLYVWAQTSKGYSQIYAGPTYAPKAWVQFGIGLGVEQAAHPLRGGTFLWLGKEVGTKKRMVSNIFLAELGKTRGSFWYKDEFLVQASKRTAVGAIAQRGLGVGPDVQVKLYKHLTLWGAPAYDFEARKLKATLGVRATF